MMSTSRADLAWTAAEVLPPITTVGERSPEWDSMLERAHAVALKTVEHWREVGLREPAPLRSVFAFGSYGDMRYADVLRLLNPRVDEPAARVAAAKSMDDLTFNPGYLVKDARGAARENRPLASLDVIDPSLNQASYRRRAGEAEIAMTSLMRDNLRDAIETSPLRDGSVLAHQAAMHLLSRYMILDETVEQAFADYMVGAALDQAEPYLGMAEAHAYALEQSRARPGISIGPVRADMARVLETRRLSGDRTVDDLDRFVRRASPHAAGQPLRGWMWRVRQSLAESDRPRFDRLVIDVLEDLSLVPLRNHYDHGVLGRRGRLDLAWLIPAALAMAVETPASSSHEPYPRRLNARTIRLVDDVEDVLRRMPAIGRVALYGFDRPRSHADVVTPEVLRAFDRAAQRSAPDLVPALRELTAHATGRSVRVIEYGPGREALFFPPPIALGPGLKRLQTLLLKIERVRPLLQIGPPSTKLLEEYLDALAPLQEFERTGKLHQLWMPGTSLGNKASVTAGSVVFLCSKWLMGG